MNIEFEISMKKHPTSHKLNEELISCLNDCAAILHSVYEQPMPGDLQASAKLCSERASKLAEKLRGKIT